MFLEYNLKLIDKKLLQKKLKEYIELTDAVEGERGSKGLVLKALFI